MHILTSKYKDKQWCHDLVKCYRYNYYQTERNHRDQSLGTYSINKGLLNCMYAMVSLIVMVVF
jgi:hypothetical protein